MVQRAKSRSHGLDTQTLPQTPSVRVTLKISRCIKGEGKGGKQLTQQWQQGTTTTSGEESGTGMVGWVPLHPCSGDPAQNLQGMGFGDTQKSGHLPTHHREEAGVEVEGHREKFLLLTHHATREEGRSLTHLWSVLQTTRKTVHFSQPPSHLPPASSLGKATQPQGGGEPSMGLFQLGHQGTDPVTFPQ